MWQCYHQTKQKPRYLNQIGQSVKPTMKTKIHIWCLCLWRVCLYTRYMHLLCTYNYTIMHKAMVYMKEYKYPSNEYSCGISVCDVFVFGVYGRGWIYFSGVHIFIKYKAKTHKSWLIFELISITLSIKICLASFCAVIIVVVSWLKCLVFEEYIF